MKSKQITPLTERDIHQKLEEQSLQLKNIISAVHDLPLHIYLSLAIIATFIAISFTYLFDDQFFWYLSIIGLIFIVGLLLLLLRKRRNKQTI